MIEWEVFGKAIKVLHAYVFLTPASSDVRQTAAFQQISPLIQNVHEISMLREWHRLDDDSSPAIARAKDYLLYCLWLLYSREYSDAHDIIYTACMLAQRNAPILRLSYRSTIREVYHDAAIAMITYYGDLKLLSHTLFSRRRYESRKADSDVPIDPSYYWPSWVPDWRLRPWGLGSTTFDLSDFVLSPQLVFNACGGLKAQFKFSDNSKILNVVGVQVGRINKVFRATETHDSVDPVRQQSPDTDWGLLRLTPPLDQQQYIAGGSWAAAWIKTCEILDRESYSGTGKRTLHLPENGFENVLRSMNYHGQRPPETVTNDTGTYQYGAPEPPSWDGINVILKPQRVKTPRGDSFVEERFHLISLDSGHVGFGGYAVREGDFVCIIKGGSYPYVLRQRRDGLFHLISDSCAFNATIYRQCTVLTIPFRCTRHHEWRIYLQQPRCGCKMAGIWNCIGSFVLLDLHSSLIAMKLDTHPGNRSMESTVHPKLRNPHEMYRKTETSLIPLQVHYFRDLVIP
jgi:hypothetical protein